MESVSHFLKSYYQILHKLNKTVLQVLNTLLYLPHLSKLIVKFDCFQAPTAAGMSLVVTRPPPHLQTSSKDSDPFWQVKTDGIDEVGIANCIIGSLFDGLMGCLKAVLDHTRQSRPEPPHYWSLEKSAAALLFWGSDHGVSHGNLDRALKHSRLLRDTVLLVLTSIGDLLSQSKHMS
jgi:hypothetical protein